VIPTLVFLERLCPGFLLADAVQTNGLGSASWLFHVAMDGVFEVGDVVKDSASNGTSCYETEEAVDLIAP
jgi:hypothetical protein